MNITENEPGQGGKFFTSGNSTRYGVVEIPQNTTSPTTEMTTRKVHPSTDWFISVSIMNLKIIAGLTAFSLLTVLKQTSESPEFTVNIILLNNSENEPGQGGKFFTSGNSTRYGVVEIPQNTTSPTTEMTTRKVHPSTDWFISVSIMNLKIIAGLTAFSLLTVLKQTSESPEFTVNIILLNNSAFCVFYVMYGVLRKNSYELYTFIAAILCIVVYCVAEYGLNEEQTSDKLVRIISGCILTPLNIYLALKVARDFKISGAYEDVKSNDDRTAFYSALLKFDLQVTTSFVMLALKRSTDHVLLEQVTLGVGIPYAILWAILGWFILKVEIQCLALLFFILGLAKPLYYVFQIVMIYINLSKNHDLKPTLILYSFLVFGAFCLLVWLVLMLKLAVVYQSFGRGPRESAVKKNPDEHSKLLDSDSQQYITI